MKLSSLAWVAVLGLVTLGGCNQSVTTKTAPPQEPTAETSNPIAEAQGVAEGSYPQLLAVVTKTQDAVNAQNLDQAKTEFVTFEDAWAGVEDGIKERSPDSYEAIEDDMNQVNGALTSANTEKTIAALQTMADHIKVIPAN